MNPEEKLSNFVIEAIQAGPINRNRLSEDEINSSPSARKIFEFLTLLRKEVPPLGRPHTVAFTWYLDFFGNLVAGLAVHIQPHRLSNNEGAVRIDPLDLEKPIERWVAEVAEIAKTPKKRCGDTPQEEIKVPTITDLSEEKCKHAQVQIELLVHSLNQCKLYAEDYASGRQNLGKTYGVLFQTKDMIDGVASELLKLHQPLKST